MRRIGVLVVAAGFLVGGCGSEETADAELAVYLSAPLSGPSADEGRDIADGAELALADAGGEAVGVSIRLEVLDDANRDGWDAATVGANARTAIQDSTTIAYIGELESGATRTSLPITNEAGILQVSAGSGASDLTEADIGSTQVPIGTQPSGARTFGRVIPSDVRQGEAAGAWMKELGIATVSALGKPSPFGDSLLAGLEAAGGPALVEEEDGPDAVYVAMESLLDGLPELKGLPEQPKIIPPTPGRVPLFGSDAMLGRGELVTLRLLTSACETRTDCPGNPREVRATAAAMDPAQLPTGADDFLTAFEAEYGRPPGRYAAYGYEAMALVLDSIERAEDPLDRGSVVDAFFATADRESILGTYSIDEVGDTTLDTLGAYEIVDGRPEPEREALTLP